MMQPESSTIAVVGLGYVGLPLAVEFGKKLDVVGYDINPRRVHELRAGHDHTLEVSEDALAAASRLRFTIHPHDMVDANVYIVTTPTPIDAAKQPDLSPVLSATEKPCTPSSTCCGTPPTLVATTGNPAANASMIATGSPSCADPSRNRSEAAIRASTSRRYPSS